MLYLWWNWTKWIYSFDALTLLMKIVRNFRRRKFSSVGREGWYEKMKDGQKLKLGDSHVTPRHIQEVQASKLGDAQGIPFFINKNIRFLSKHYIFIPSHDMCYSWNVILFCFQFCFVCLLVINSWILAFLFWRETHSLFIV